MILALVHLCNVFEFTVHMELLFFFFYFFFFLNPFFEMQTAQNVHRLCLTMVSLKFGNTVLAIPYHSFYGRPIPRPFTLLSLIVSKVKSCRVKYDVMMTVRTRLTAYVISEYGNIFLKESRVLKSYPIHMFATTVNCSTSENRDKMSHGVRKPVFGTSDQF